MWHLASGGGFAVCFQFKTVSKLKITISCSGSWSFSSLRPFPSFSKLDWVNDDGSLQGIDDRVWFSRSSPNKNLLCQLRSKSFTHFRCLLLARLFNLTASKWIGDFIEHKILIKWNAILIRHLATLMIKATLKWSLKLAAFLFHRAHYHNRLPYMAAKK